MRPCCQKMGKAKRLVLCSSYARYLQRFKCRRQWCRVLLQAMESRDAFTVLNLITVLAWTPRDVDSVDEYGIADVFLYCPCGREHRCFPCDESVNEDEYDEWSEYRSRWS